MERHKLVSPGLGDAGIDTGIGRIGVDQAFGEGQRPFDTRRNRTGFGGGMFD